MDNQQESSTTVPQRIGAWRVVRLLGQGGMAEVYEVEDDRLGIRYALKLFTYARGGEVTARERFFAEGKLLAKLDHPRLVRVYDLGEDSATGRPYFVMDLVRNPEGRPQTLAAVDSADEDQVAMWYEDLRSALAYIHAQGILHRDLKLQNVLVGADGHAVLSDFGVAKIFDPGLRADLGLSAEQTFMAVKGGQKTVMGSVGYMAPEVEMGVAASKESDWYALGVIVFRLLTGVWCDSRTDVVGDLETYSPVWLDILPKLLHSNPAGRECPSWTELARAHHERELAEAERAFEKLRLKRHAAVRGRRNGWIAAAFMFLAFAVAGLFAYRLALMPGGAFQEPCFEDVCVVPADAPMESDDEDETPTRSELELARVDAWVLTQGLFSDLRAGRIPRGKVASEILRMAQEAKDDELEYAEELGVDEDVFDYTPLADSSALSALLYGTYSNLCGKVVK